MPSTEFKDNRLYLLAFLLALSVRYLYVHAFAGPMPFYDQWDAEGISLLKPWIEGNLSVQHFWLPHNEHRILPSRLLTIASYELTGTWNNRYLAHLNVLLALLPWILTFLCLLKLNALTGKMRWAVLVFIFPALLPFGWENFLVGFQSQMYMQLVFITSALIIAATRPVTGPNGCMLVLLSLLSVMTMASGLLTPVAIVLTYLIRFKNSMELRQVFLIGIPLIIIFAFGVAILPAPQDHEGVRAQNLFDLIKSAAFLMSWPWKSYGLASIIFWFPTVAFLAMRTERNDADTLMSGFIIWESLQILAIAYGRGHDLGGIPSRYTDMLIPGVIANFWFALRIWEMKSFKNRRTFITIYFVALGLTFVLRSKRDFKDMHQRYKQNLAARANVSDYLISGDQRFLKELGRQIPYPDPDRLKIYLDDPTLRSILPDKTP